MKDLTDSRDKRKTSSSSDALNLQLDRLMKDGKLNSWTEFVTALNVPNDLLAVLMSNRPELVKLIRPRALSADEHKVYLDLISGLIETNAALRQHAQQVARLTMNWANAFKALHSVGQRIEAFANFKRTDAAYADESEEDA